MISILPWYIFAFTSAIFNTLFQIIRKKAVSKAHAMNFESVRAMYEALLALLLIPFISWSFDKSVLIWIYIVSLIAVIGILYASKAFRHGEISLISPWANMRPFFVAVLAFIFLNEALTIKQIIGISIILISAYLLESDHRISSFIEPLKHLLKSKYSLYFIFATFLFSITSVLDKFVLTTRMDNIFTYSFFIWIFIAVNFNIIHTMMYGFKDTLECLKKEKHLPVIVALCSMLSGLLAYKAFTMAYVSLVMPILMMSTLFTVLLGGRFFHEKNLLFRLGTSVIMLFGAYLIIV
ncbi:EamA family transporter [Candidatus Woesearchaeota archaeon]|nr:EamA family transporter [Candidatus Woesearchaeota archaeon]